MLSEPFSNVTFEIVSTAHNQCRWQLAEPSKMIPPKQLRFCEQNGEVGLKSELVAINLHGQIA